MHTHIFVTHCHGDHSNCLPQSISRHRPPHIFLPEESVTACENLLSSWQRFKLNLHDGDGYTEEDLEDESADNGAENSGAVFCEKDLLETYRLHGMKGGLVFDLPPPCEGRHAEEKRSKRGRGQTARSSSHSGYNDMRVHVFSCFHRVPCVGYGFSQMRRKLKPEYADLEGREIGRLRKEGVEVSSMEEIHLFAFLGDTTVELLQPRNEEIGGEGKYMSSTAQQLRLYPVVMMECTFLGAKDLEDERRRARKTGHILWEQIKEFVIDNPQTTFVLMHFSRRYSAEEVKLFFEEERERESARLGNSVLENVVALVPGGGGGSVTVWEDGIGNR